MNQRPGWDDAYSGPFALPDLDGDGALEDRQAKWRCGLADAIYGPIPDAPDGISYEFQSLEGTSARRLVLEIKHGARVFSVDAALWLPKRETPAPLIAGLSFTGPIGVLDGDTFPLDFNARAYSQPELGAPEGRLHDVLRGTEAHRWPIEMLIERGFAVLISCYGSWAPDDPDHFQYHGLRPFLGVETGAISLWAWALQRLVDLGVLLPEIDENRVTVAGHSRLGKAALWAAANDARIGAVFANNAGCGGAAPARHAVGEALDGMARNFSHWIRPQTDRSPLDQHHLMGCIAPRALYVASADRDLWADPVGTYIALCEASKVWSEPMDWPSPDAMWAASVETHHRAIGHHLRHGDHEMLPEDWAQFLRFLSHSQI